MISQSEIDKRGEILQAALKLFVEYGFHGTPTSKIAQEAGVANGTLFHYFKTKDELIISLYTDLKTKMAVFDGAGKTSEKAYLKEKYKLAYVNTLTWGLQNPLGFRFLQQFSASPFLALIAPDEVKKQTAPALNMIEQGIKAGLLKAAPPEFLYSILTSHIYGMNEYFIKANLPAAQQKELISDSFEMLWRMMT